MKRSADEIDQLLAPYDDGLTILSDSIRIPFDLVDPFRRLLVEQSHGESDLVLVDDAYATVKCRVEDAPKARLLWQGFRAGISVSASSAVERKTADGAEDAELPPRTITLDQYEELKALLNASAGLYAALDDIEAAVRWLLHAPAPEGGNDHVFDAVMNGEGDADALLEQLGIALPSAPSASSAVEMPAGATAESAEDAERQMLATHGIAYHTPAYEGGGPAGGEA